MRERRLHNCFYTGSLNHKATSSFPGQPEPGFHYIFLSINLKNYFFVNCHSTLFKCVIWILFEIYECYVLYVILIYD